MRNTIDLYKIIANPQKVLSSAVEVKCCEGNQGVIIGQQGREDLVYIDTSITPDLVWTLMQIYATAEKG